MYLSEKRFLMDEKEVIKVVESINEYVANELWMDFDIALTNGWDLTIIGRLDNTLKEANIEIAFEQMSFVSIPFGWKADTSSRVIELATQKEIEEFTDKFEVESGNLYSTDRKIRSIGPSGK